jgi:hypothetical protein
MWEDCVLPKCRPGDKTGDMHTLQKDRSCGYTTGTAGRSEDDRLKYARREMNMHRKGLSIEELRSHPLIQQYAAVDDELYGLIEATNPTLKMMIDTAKEIAGVEY